MSLGNEITGIISIMAYTMFLLNIEVERLQKSQDDTSNNSDHPSPDDEFVPMTIVASGGVVDLPKLQ